jgi:hypothetical protein
LKNAVFQAGFSLAYRGGFHLPWSASGLALLAFVGVLSGNEFPIKTD